MNGDNNNGNSESCSMCSGSSSIQSYKCRGYALLSSLSINTICSLLTINGLFSVLAFNAVGSIASINSFFSVASVNSIFSFGCIGSSFEICTDADGIQAAVIVLVVAGVVALSVLLYTLVRNQGTASGAATALVSRPPYVELLGPGVRVDSHAHLSAPEDNRPAPAGFS